MARQRHSGLKEQYCPICNQTYAPGTREFNEEHIVPYALGNRKWVLKICKACNTQMNEIDQAFSRLPDMVQGRMEFGHTDRKHRKAESRLETHFDMRGLNVQMRPAWDGERFVPFTVPRIQRQYGTGPLYRVGSDVHTPEGREKVRKELQKLRDRGQISDVLPTTSTLLHLPDPRHVTQLETRTSIEIKHDIRIREVLKVLVESLSTHCNPAFNRLSCMQVVRELLFLEGDEAFFERMYQLEEAGVYQSFHHTIKVPAILGSDILQDVVHGGQSLHFQQHPFDLDAHLKRVGFDGTRRVHAFHLKVDRLDFGQGNRGYLTWCFNYYGYFHGALFLPLQEADEHLLGGEHLEYADEVRMDGKHHPLKHQVPTELQKTARKK